MNVKIREYQGWSLNNTKNMINYYDLDGVIVLVSDKEINEVESIVLEKIVRDNAMIWEGLNITINIFKGKYEKETDSIIIYNFYSSFNKQVINLGNGKYRFLTDKECWLLQGYSEEDYNNAARVNSKRALYKQAGNSILVPIFESIFKQLLNIK